MGGNCPLRLNIGPRPIANKYREGKMKRTLERELKVPENAVREANGTSFLLSDWCRLWPELFLAVGCQRKLGGGRKCSDVTVPCGFGSYVARSLSRFRNAGAYHLGIIVVEVSWTL